MPTKQLDHDRTYLGLSESVVPGAARPPGELQPSVDPGLQLRYTECEVYLARLVGVSKNFNSTHLQEIWVG